MEEAKSARLGNMKAEVRRGDVTVNTSSVFSKTIDAHTVRIAARHAGSIYCPAQKHSSHDFQTSSIYVLGYWM